MVSAATRLLWDEYLRLHAVPLRRAAMQGLERFLTAMAKEPEPAQHAFAFALAAQVVDAHIDVPLQHPLKERLLWPALVHGCKADVPGCARWLAALWDHRLEKAMPAEVANPQALLRAALRRDPNDQIARGLLIEEKARWLEFAIHELPDGLSLGAGPTTIEDCRGAEGELDVFEQLLREAGRGGDHEWLRATCRLHFVLYREYLGAPDRPSYPEYLQRRGVQQAAISRRYPIGPQRRGDSSPGS